MTTAGEELGRLRAEVEAVRGRRQNAMEHFDTVYAESLRMVETAFVMAGIRGQRLKSLRPYYWRRRLVDWARKKRRVRAERRAAVAGGRAGAPAARAGWRLPGLGLASVSKWLKRRRVFG